MPAQYGIVTLNMTECINSMIEELWSEVWMVLLEGTLHHMTQRICDKRQDCILKGGDDIVPKVKAILWDSFHKLQQWKLLNFLREISVWSWKERVPL